MNVATTQKKIKILVLTSSFPRHKEDWWAQFIVNIYKHFPKNKYSITVLTPHSPNAKFNERFADIQVFRFPYFFPYHLQRLTTGDGILHKNGDFFGKVQVISLLVCQTVFLFFHLLQNRYSIIHAHWVLPQGFQAMIMGSIFSIPYVVTVHGSDVFGLRRLNFFKSIVLRYAVYCTANSKSTYDQVLKIYQKTNVKYIPMGIDTNIFINKKDGKRTGNTILTVGRLIKCKGIIYALRAMPLIRRQIKDIRLFIVGAGPEEDALRREVRKLRLDKHVFFYGNLAHSELASLYRSSDVFVAPAITDLKTGEREGQGLALIEAMASGLPVVASRSGGIRYIIKDRITGVLTSEKDVHALSSEILNILRDKLYAKKLSQTAMKDVRSEYSWEKVSRAFDKLFDTIGLI